MLNTFLYTAKPQPETVEALQAVIRLMQDKFP